MPMAEKILVVEDERNIASFVSMYLKNARYHVDIARDGTEALQKADATKPDLVVLDLMLPGHRRARGLPPDPLDRPTCRS